MLLKLKCVKQTISAKRTNDRRTAGESLQISYWLKSKMLRKRLSSMTLQSLDYNLNRQIKRLTLLTITSLRTLLTLTKLNFKFIATGASKRGFTDSRHTNHKHSCEKICTTRRALARLPNDLKASVKKLSTTETRKTFSLRKFATQKWGSLLSLL